MNLVIKVTAGDAVATVKQVAGEAARTEGALAQAGEAGTKAMGAVAAGGEKASKSLSGAAKSIADAREALDKFAAMTNPFAALNAQFQREADILERIRGPLREYRADMEALEMLFKKNALSAAEYESELARLIKTQGSMQGPVQQPGVAEADTKRAAATIGFGGARPRVDGGGMEGLTSTVASIAPKFGILGTAFSEILTKGMLVKAVLIGMAAEAINLGNQYIQLANKAQKLTAAGGDVNETLRTQMSMSRDLHGSLNGTIELYDAVRDGTDDLNLSQREQIQLTRDIGASVVASGKSVEQAGGLMGKLTYAFASGSINGRELKGIMKEFPDIGAAFVTTLGHSRKELIAMANDGRFSSEMLITAFNKMGPEMQEKVGKKAETTGQMFGHFKDQMILSIGRLTESTGVFKAVGAALEGLARGFAFVVDIAQILIERLGEQLWLLKATIGVVWDLTKAAFSLGEALGEALFTGGLMDQAGNGAIIRQGEIARAYLARMEALKLLGVEEEKNARTAVIQAAAQKMGVLGPAAAPFDETSANKWAEARITMKQLGVDIGAAFDESKTKAIAFDAVIERIKEGKAAEKISDDARKIWKELSRTNDVIDLQKKNWKDLEARSAEYADALQRVMKNHAEHPGLPFSRDDIEIMRGARDVQMEMDHGLGQYGKTVLDAKRKTEEHNRTLEDLKGAYAAGQLSLKEFTNAMKGAGTDVLDIQANRLRELKLRVEEYGKALDKVNMANTDGVASRQQIELERGERDALLELTNGTTRFGETVVDVSRKVNQHRDKIVDLTGAMKSNTLTVQGQAQAWKELKALLMDDPTYKMFVDLNEPAEKWSQSLRSLGSLYRSNLIDLRTYNEEMQKLARQFSARFSMDERKVPSFVGPKKIGKQDYAVGYDAPVESPAPPVTGLTGAPLFAVSDGAQQAAELGLDKLTKKYLEQFMLIERWKSAQYEAVEALRDTRKEQAIAAEVAQAEAMARAEDIEITDELTASFEDSIRAREAATELMSNEQQILASMRGPQEQYEAHLAAINDLLKRIPISSEQYRAEVDRIRGSYLASSAAGKTFLGGMEAQWLKMKEDAASFGATVAGLVVDDLGKLTDALVTVANGGKVAWGDMVDSMIQDIERLLLKQLLISTISLISGGSVPGFATGGSFLVGGNGGTDTTPVNFMATRGELVTIQTPAQQGFTAGADQQATAPAAPPVVNVKNVTVVDPAMIPSAMDSPAGHQVILNVIKANQPAVRGRRGG